VHKSTLSRREVLLGSLALVANASYPLFGQNDQNEALALSPKVINAITLFQPSDKRLPYLLDRFFPGYWTNPDMQALLPHTAIIRNGGHSPVKAYNFSWKPKTSSERHAIFTKLFVSRPTLTNPRIIGTGRNTILLPGQAAILTPLFLWSESRYTLHHGDIPLESLAKADPAAVAFLLQADTNTEYTVVRNTKICRRTAIGDDTSSAKEYDGYRHAEREVAIALQQAGEDHASIGALLADLRRNLESTGQNSAQLTAKLNYLDSLIAAAQILPRQTLLAHINTVALRPNRSTKCQARKHIRTVAGRTLQV